MPGFDPGTHAQPSNFHGCSHQPAPLASAGRCALRSAPGEAFPVARGVLKLRA